MKRISKGRRTPDPHPDTHEMLAYLEATLEPKRRAALEAHLAGPCLDCQIRLRDCGRLVERMRSDRTPEVPEVLHRIALDAFGELRTRSASAPFAERVARLLLDTLGRPMSLAARRSVGEVRRLRFDAGGMPVELEVEMESAGRFTLRGRVDAAESHRIRIEVGEERFEARPDAGGLFALPGLPAGRAKVAIEGSEGVWALPPFELDAG